MIDGRFSAASFEQCGQDTASARALADSLAEVIQTEMHELMWSKFQEIIRTLNSMGHNLRPEGEQKKADYSFRDDSEDASSTYRCKLRVALDLVVSTGYSHLISSEDVYAGYDGKR